MLDMIFLMFLLEFNKPNDSFVMPVSKTYPEERNVLVAVPVIPVEIEVID